MIKIRACTGNNLCNVCHNHGNDIKEITISDKDNGFAVNLCPKCREDLINKLIKISETKRSEDVKDCD